MTTVSTAIEKAIEYETRVRDVYSDAARKEVDPTGKQLFELLSEEEAAHVAFLEHALARWQSTGTLGDEVPTTRFPSSALLTDSASRVGECVADEPIDQAARLEQALCVEQETSDFFREIVNELPSEARGMFERFLEIEDGHLAIVQAELDSVRGMGFWFDVREFDLESA
jgi:rubrerythrin